MSQQSAEQLIPFLQLLDQPAFCLDDAGTITANAAARRLAPGHKDALPAWLGDSAPLYDAWDRRSVLELPVAVRGEAYLARFTPLSDGTAVVLKADRLAVSDSDPLSVTAQVLMQPLTTLHGMIQQLSDDPAMDPYADTTALEEDLGFRPNTPLREGLRRFARWYKEFYNV